jgi:hypothetical protein
LRFGRFLTDSDLWIRTWISIQRIIAAIAILIFHAGFQRILQLLFATQLRRIETLLDVVESVMVLAVTAALLVEAVRVFLPPPWGIKLDLEKAEEALRQSDGPSTHS